MSKYKAFSEDGLTALVNYLKGTKRTVDENSSAVSSLEVDFQEMVQQMVTVLEDLNTVKADTDAVESAMEGKQDILTFDTKPTSGSLNPVTSDGIYNVIGDIDAILDSINGEVI